MIFDLKNHGANVILALKNTSAFVKIAHSPHCAPYVEPSLWSWFALTCRSVTSKSNKAFTLVMKTLIAREIASVLQFNDVLLATSPLVA